MSNLEKNPMWIKNPETGEVEKVFLQDEEYKKKYHEDGDIHTLKRMYLRKVGEERYTGFIITRTCIIPPGCEINDIRDIHCTDDEIKNA